MSSVMTGQALANIALVDEDILANERTVCALLVTSLPAERAISSVFIMPAPSHSTT
jgi:hypothetical protein